MYMIINRFIVHQINKHIIKCHVSTSGGHIAQRQSLTGNGTEINKGLGRGFALVLLESRLEKEETTS